jgi:hypothetical protein
MTFFASVLLNGVEVLLENVGFRLEMDEMKAHRCVVEALNPPEHYSLGAVCEVYCDLASPPAKKIFDGVVEEVAYSSKPFDILLCSLSCTELFHVKASGVLVAERFFGKKAGWIVRYLVEKYLPEFDASEVEDGDVTIDEIVLDYMSLLDALDEVASLSSYTYYATPDRKILFKPVGLEEEPLEITPQMISEVSSFKKSIEQMKNKITVIGGYDKEVDQQSTSVEAFQPLYEKSFAQPFTPTQRSIMRVELFLRKVGEPTNLVTGKVVEDVAGYGPRGARVCGFAFNPSDIPQQGGWVSAPVDEALREKKHWIILDKCGDSSNTVEWGYASSGEYAESIDGENWTVSSGKTFAFREYYGEPVLEQAFDPSSAAKYGVREDIVVDRNISNKLTAKRLALATLREKSRVGLELTLRCLDLPLIPHPGRIVRVTYPRLGLFYAQMRVEKVALEFEPGRIGADEVELTLVGEE